MRLERRIGYETEARRLHALSKLLWSRSGSFEAKFSITSSLPLPGVLCDPNDLIWKQGNPFEAMIVQSSSDCLLFEILQGFPQL